MVEQFNEWVASPWTQPPLHREDEDPAAQVPHQLEDESSESSTPDPLIRKRRVVVTQEAAATSEKSLEVTLEPPAPVADTTSQAPVAHTTNKLYVKKKEKEEEKNKCVVSIRSKAT